MADEPVFMRCRNCGRLVPENEAVARWYCSRDCVMQFSSCPNCGRYFETGKGSGNYCSPDCAQTYPEGRSPAGNPETEISKEKEE